jgi:hypothetical protein
LGITTVAQLVGRNADELFERLCEVTGHPNDVCCRDVFNAAIAQAENPNLSHEKCQWWYWSRVRRRKA